MSGDGQVVIIPVDNDLERRLAGFRGANGGFNTQELRCPSRPLELSSWMELLRDNKGAGSVLCCVVTQI